MTRQEIQDALWSAIELNSALSGDSDDSLLFYGVTDMIETGGIPPIIRLTFEDGTYADISVYVNKAR